jgi:hypothetical protein
MERRGSNQSARSLETQAIGEGDSQHSMFFTPDESDIPFAPQRGPSDPLVAMLVDLLTVLKACSPNPTLGDALVRHWLAYGMKLGVAFEENIVVLGDALRRHLPPYHGPGLTLVRGQIETLHRKQCYGLSWTPDIEVARMHATHHGAGEGDAVVLRMDVSAEMIIADLREYPHASIAQREPQFLVDPRMVSGIEVIETVPWPSSED